MTPIAAQVTIKYSSHIDGCAAAYVSALEKTKVTISCDAANAYIGSGGLYVLAIGY